MDKGIEERKNILGMRFMLGDEEYTVFETTKTSVYSIPLKGSLDTCRVDDSTTFLSLFDKGIALRLPDVSVLSKEVLSKRGREKLERNYSFIREVEAAYGSFAALKGRFRKDELYRIISKYGLSVPTAWRLINKYLKGGCTEQALFSSRCCVDKGPVISGAKRGARSKKPKGVDPSPELQHHLEWGLKEWKTNKYKGFRSAYRMMLKVFYTYIDENGYRAIMPEKDIPTMKQFIYYCNKHLSEAERLIAKTSRREFENNERILLSNELATAKRPFSHLQADAFEAGIQLVSDVDPTQCIGKATVYTMSDVYTRMIVSAVPGLEVNSRQGACDSMEDLMLTDHTLLLSNLGFVDFDKDLWPSFIKPDRISCDRGAEYRSDYFLEVCSRLKIERSLEPPAMGSGKGIVERSYREFTDFFKSIFADFGATNREYGDNGRKTAVITLSGFRKVLARFVLYHNAKVNTKYPLDENMIREGVKPSPVELYRYGSRFGLGARVSDAQRLSVYYDLLVQDNAIITREGIVYMGLYYKPENDPELMERIQKAKGNAGKRHVDGTRFNDITIRYDLHNIGHLYYISSTGEIKSMVLNVAKSRLTPTISWSEYTILKAKKDGLIRDSAYRNDVNAIEAERYAATIIEKNRHTTYATEEGIREARAQNKARVSLERKFSDKPEFANVVGISEPKVPKKESVVLTGFDFENTRPWD